ncbi:PREDICTED: protein lin-37 homolog isoform X3 [Papilio xuthus]|uniref:Protein lin-37 homolog isoform X3 n=1 Tax=Papilio xuthus TaxID=66420 RepID=A0AAJ6ZDI4_PAPXU|nr:PREDICTED: protein lin-37 homolog isoform X3 [Papilio xuthus]
MSKRIRLLATKNKSKTSNGKDSDENKTRGRLKGALLEVLGDESDGSTGSPVKRRRQSSYDQHRDYSSEDERPRRKQSPVRQSYVLKLFDRSVDLSQFSEDSPLYPICRAWIANQPKADYSEFGKSIPEPETLEDSVELPGPEGPPVSRIPDLTPEQKLCNKDKINLNYREAPPPSREKLLEEYSKRWNGIRLAWLAQGAKVEARYTETQRVLNNINVNAL